MLEKWKALLCTHISGQPSSRGLCTSVIPRLHLSHVAWECFGHDVKSFCEIFWCANESSFGRGPNSRGFMWSGITGRWKFQASIVHVVPFCLNIWNSKRQSMQAHSARPFSKFTICFIDIHSHAFGFTLGMKSQSVVYLLRRREQIYWILSLQGEVHSIWDLWRNNLQRCKVDFFGVGWTANNCRWGFEKSK
jgi:hypothetical protein